MANSNQPAVLPDPQTASFSSAVEFFSQHQSSSLPFRVLHRRIYSSTDYQWELILEYQNYDISSLNSVRSLAQSFYNTLGASVRSVSLSEATIGYLWSVMISKIRGKLQSKKGPTRKKATPAEICRRKTQTVSSVNSPNIKTEDQEADAFYVLVRRGISNIKVPVDQVQPTDYVRKLYRGDVDVTRRYTARGALCRTIFNIIKDSLMLGWKVVRDKLTSAKVKKPPAWSGINFVSGGVLVSNQPPKTVIPKAPKEDGAVSGVPCDYAFEERYHYRALSDSQVFHAARMYLHHFLKTGSQSSTFSSTADRSTISLIQKLRSHGLPIGKPLLDLYLKYCTDLDTSIKASNVMQDLTSIFSSVHYC